MQLRMFIEMYEMYAWCFTSIENVIHEYVYDAFGTLVNANTLRHLCSGV